MSRLNLYFSLICLFHFNFFIGTHEVYAEEGPISIALKESQISLDLKSSVIIALNNNLGQKKAELGHASAEAKIKQVESAMNLKIDTSASGSRQTYNSISSSEIFVYNDTMSQLQIQKVLFLNRDIKHLINLANLENQGSVYEKHLTKNDVIFNTKILYWKIITLNALAAIGKEKVGQYRTILDFSESKEKYGYGIRLDTQWARVQLGLAEDDLVETLNELHLTEVIFRQTLGLSEKTSFSLTDELPYKEAKISLARVELQENDPSLKIANLEIQKAKQNQEYSKKRLLPNMSITSVYNKNDGESTALGFDTNWNLSLTEGYPIRYDVPVFYQNNYFYGFNISYPFFDGGQASANYNYASSIVESEKNNFNLTHDQLATKITQNKLDYENAVNRVRNLNEISAVSKGIVEAANIKFKEGQYTLVQLVNVESDNASAQKKYIEALYDLNVTTEALKKDLLIEEYKNESNI